MIITGQHIKAARALIDMSQPRLAELAGVGLTCIVNLEKSKWDKPKTFASNLERIITVLENHDVLFLTAGVAYMGDITDDELSELIAEKSGETNTSANRETTSA